MKKMNLKLLLVMGLFMSTTLFAQKKSTIELPFSMDQNLIIIEAKLSNKKPNPFIFDTGTEGIMLWDSLAQSYPSAGFDTMTTPTGEVVGIQEQVAIPKIGFGSLILKNRTAIKMPRQMIFSKNAVGIIGMKTFMGYMITIDYRKRKILLSNGDLLNQSDVISIQTEHLLEGKVKLNGKEVLAHFDCGGAGYISVPKSWDSIYKLKTEPVYMAKGRTPMGDFDVYKTELDGDIEVGNYKIINPTINLVTGDFFYSMNFGYGFFKDHLITIDTKNKLMQIKH